MDYRDYSIPNFLLNVICYDILFSEQFNFSVEMHIEHW